MTQRNPMNERYTTERKGGATRGGASSMKPASHAASSVRVENPKKRGTARSRAVASATQPDTRTKEQKKAERAKEREREDTLYTASTILCNKDARYRTYRKWWWTMLIGAVVFTLLSWMLLSLSTSSVLSIVVLVLAYGTIIAALVLDVTVIRKRRNLYRTQVESMSRKQVDRIIADSYVERRAKDEAKKARKQARKDGKDPEAAGKAAYDEVMATAAKGSEGYAELLARAQAEEDAKKAGKKPLFGKSKASEQAASGSTKVTEVAADDDDAAAGKADASPVTPEAQAEAARKEAAARAAREFNASRRSGTNR